MGDSSSAQSVSITSGVDLDYTPCPPGLSQSQVRSRWSRGLPPDQEQELLQARQNQAVLIEQVDRSLGAVSVAAILFNRCIGSGIWNSPALVFYNTQSIGGSILMWLYGALTCMAGVVLYIELGLTVPRWRLPDGTKFSTPRSGAELVYVCLSPLSTQEHIRRLTSDSFPSSTTSSRYPNSLRHACTACPSSSTATQRPTLWHLRSPPSKARAPT